MSPHQIGGKDELLRFTQFKTYEDPMTFIPKEYDWHWLAHSFAAFEKQNGA